MALRRPRPAFLGSRTSSPRASRWPRSAGSLRLAPSLTPAQIEISIYEDRCSSGSSSSGSSSSGSGSSGGGAGGAGGR